MEKALIAMSGGVDSSLAAKLVKALGYDCIGCTMKLYDNEDIGLSCQHTCCSLEDIEDARRIAHGLGMPYYVFNFKDDFRKTVIERFIRAYESGLTPNPCIDCNRYMKFEKLFDRAVILGCDYVVTGHYARIEQAGKKFVLKKALDASKDQSYVLYFMTQEQLAHCLFPLGTLRKTQVRALAAQSGFVNAQKADSQDLCFVPDGDYAAFIERQTGRRCQPGNFETEDGTVLGRHSGIIRYTLGQRRGLGLAFGTRMYVKRLDVARNAVILGAERELYARALVTERFHWISGQAPSGAIRCRAKIRYRQKEQDALACPNADGSVRIVFDTPQRAVTPGQAAVLYDGQTVLGGGTIAAAC